MAKGYWIVFYRSVASPEALAEYGKQAGPAITSQGGRFLVRGVPVKTYEAGLTQRTVVIEFESIEKAMSAFESPIYQDAVKTLAGTADRDIRIVEGVS